MIPARMNLVDIEISILARQGRVSIKDRPAVDGVYRRPRGEKKYNGINIADVVAFKAQIYYERQEEKLPTELGNSPITAGHLTMRKTTFDALTIKPETGDLIVKVAGEALDPGYVVNEIRRAGYLRGRSNLVMIFFRRSREKFGNP